MDVTFHIGFGQDHNISVELHDAEPAEAVTMLGQACNEVLRMNLALNMQEQG